MPQEGQHAWCVGCTAMGPGDILKGACYSADHTHVLCVEHGLLKMSCMCLPKDQVAGLANACVSVVGCDICSVVSG